MTDHTHAAGYLVLVVARDGTCLFSPNLEALVGVRPWDFCWDAAGRELLREAFVEACMFRQPQEEVPVSLRIEQRVFDFQAWLDPTGSELVICRMVRVFASALSAREKDVLSLVAGGASNVEISQLLGTREATIRSHLKKMRDKLGVSRPEGLLLAAVGLNELVADSPATSCPNGKQRAESDRPPQEARPSGAS